MANREDTEKYKKELMFAYGEEKANKLFSYLDMVLDRNQYINLTAVNDRDEAVQKHIADSLLACNLTEYNQAQSIIDIGTGAGFPGALLAIVNPEKNFTLMDATLKRLKVIDEFAENLEISNITTLHARAEEINRKPDYAGQYDICVSRAVANLSTLCEWCLPFVKQGGYFISYKGENYMDEVNNAAASLRKYGGKLIRVEKPSEVADEISGHVLLVIEKIK